MELQSALQIIDTLAQGIHPVTGEAMPEDSPYNAPPVIRALFAVSKAVRAQIDAQPRPMGDLMREEEQRRAGTTSTSEKRPPRQAAPPNAGKPWAPEDDATMIAGFDAGQDLKQLAETLGRTRFGIEQRLIKLGKVPPAAGFRSQPSAT